MKTLYTLFALTIILAACGRTQVTGGTQTGTDLCNTQFINAYNGLVVKAEEAKELEKNLSPDKEIAKQQIKRYIQQFRLKLIDFKSRYPAVNCKAQNTKDKTESYIDSNAVANRYWDILDNMEKEINDK